MSVWLSEVYSMKRRRNRNRKRIEISPRYVLLGLTVFCVILMVISLFAGGAFAPIREVSNMIVQPMQKGVNTIGRWVQSKTEAFENYDTLLKENEELKSQLEQTQKQVEQYQQNSYELERLQALYELDSQYADYNKTAARVISKDTSGWFDVFYIDKGTDDGIKTGCNVMFGNGLCGIVTDAGSDYAKIRSVIDDTSNVNGMILPSEAICNVEGSVNNYENGYLIAENIEKEADISVGDQVVTSYVSSKYLPGLNIGYISKIDEDSNNLTKTAYITPSCDFSKIQEVLVILETKKECLGIGVAVLRRVITLGILIIVCFVLQSALFPYIEVAGATPNLLLILTVSFGLMRGRKEGMLVGFFCGFLYDLYFGFAIGPFMIIYMLIGYCNGFFHRLYLVEDVLLPIIIIVFDDFIFNFITFIIFFVMRNRLSFSLYLREIILPDMIYTAILTMIVFKFFVFVNRRLKRAEKGSET